MRETLVFDVVSCLKRKGFSVSTFLNSNSCFDIAARHGNTILLLKVLSNIDGLREEQAQELQKAAELFNAHALIVGEKTKVFSLQKNLYYERHGIEAASLEAFSGMLENRFPTARYFKGKKIVELDTEKIRQRRKQSSMSIPELAQKASIAETTIRKTEKGRPTTLEVAEKLESILGQGLVKTANIFEKKHFRKKELFREKETDSSFEWMKELGFKIALFNHAPFRAVSEKKQELLASKALNKTDVKKKAIRLAQTQKVLKSNSFVITKGFKKKSYSNIPIIEEDELSTLSKPSDLTELLKKKQQERA